MQHPQARYELDWKTPEQLLVAAVLAGGSRDAAVNDVTKVLFARWPGTRALAKADVAQLTQVIEPLGLAQQKASPIRPANAGGALEVLTKADDYRLGRSDGERIGTPALAVPAIPSWKRSTSRPTAPTSSPFRTAERP
ncbi:MAG TPA: hypothetical protein VI094_09580 [Propionibacteriaceae bacterium]